ncbi:MAG: hypothetical protein HZA77_07765 [Candidatus Schekmanbacteria bacterium]|nr:hypothetical protein [Candidatus Schekmanbacteria bacterium]
MKKSLVRSVLILFPLLMVSGCSIKEFRSPIVFRSPLIFDDAKQQEPVQAHIPYVSKEELIGEGKVTKITSPETVPLLSDEDVVNKGMVFLGEVSIKSPAEEGISKEKAEQYLKLEAFKRYGSMAQGIANVEYSKKTRLFSSDNDLYEKASADVLTQSRKTGKTVDAGSGQISPASGQNTAVSSIAEKSFIDIPVISSEELFNKNFRILGKIILDNEYPQNFVTKDEAIRALKMEAFRLYGDRADGLTNLKFIKEAKVFYYKKTRQISPPGDPKTYLSATAEVVMLIPEEGQVK